MIVPLSWPTIEAVAAEDSIRDLDMDAESGFPWLPFGPVERLAYNLRHLQHHTGQLGERIRRATGNGVPWLGPD